MAIASVILIQQAQPAQAAVKIRGFDVSSYNGVIDWGAVEEAEMDFVMLRTGEGQAPDVDTQFETNYEGAKAAGLKVGAYHGKSKPKLPTAVDIWQYTEEGSLDGANTDQGYCDLDYSYMEAVSVKFKTDSLTMKKGTTADAKVTLGPGGCTDTVRFKSSNKKVVTVNKKTGKLHAKAKGKAVITVTTESGKTAKMKVTVK